ncbi:aminopeptidase P family protein [Ruminiclostridium herbifermentans]|uniref:Aminopeptidase P family protein n=1 Tax=Ruminiclostridium herbifermentans TaxID=2488810 RepID=A0A4U7JCJ3_9FIRM|nr:Xaa-Pro peptidase family protein [Ruminiclostridium herbifermentans]QNU65635.1 aminopeptidase P family protein [Ruminiclostridium herbifermentans]
MEERVTKLELETRIERLCNAITKRNPEWDNVLIINRINQYYLTGTMQDGLLIINKNGTAKFFVRRSLNRAIDESPLAESQICTIYPMESYRDAAKIVGSELGETFVETETLTIGIIERIKKYFKYSNLYPVENIIFEVRAVKSPYELYWLQEAGRLYNILLEEVVPSILREGMSELEFTAEMYSTMLKMGYHGVTRFYRYQTEMIAGQIGFGDSSLVETNFDSPGGMRGMCPAVPIIGSRDRILKKGDLVFIDIGFGMYGYHVDRTQIYMFGASPSDEVIEVHRKCIEIEKRAAQLLKPGNIPSEIYNNIMKELDSDFLKNFMGFGDRMVRFLGHGIGLHVDEPPVIANGFNSPLQENMVIALEPKKGIAGVGMVGVEDTYIVTPNGGKCITGGEKDIIIV